MHRDDFYGFGKQTRSRVKEKCGQHTSQERAERAGRRDQLLGRLREKPGSVTEEVKQQLEDWQQVKTQPTDGYRTEVC
jgi:uncharacterized protein YjbJ (UPF0337 family)